MKTVSKTDIGLVRSSNQDACASGLLPDGAWLVVRDGMGGANGGNVASQIALSCMEKQITGEYEAGLESSGIRGLLTAAAYSANTSVYDAACKDPMLSGMGTTLVAVIVARGKAHIVHAGDSRAYLISPSGVRQLTMDHSMVQEMLNRGDITQEEAASHPHRNIITRALGVQEMIDVDYTEIPFGTGETLLACSDGLSNYVHAEQMYQLASRFNGEELAQQMVQTALGGGGSDNITVALIEN